MIAIHNLEIPYRFPSAVTKEAEAAKEATLKGREDWRHIPLLTIDPHDAKDHDDAVYAEPDTDEKNEGGHIVFVAIADVAAYVRPGTALDREAYIRGNSVYFPDRVVPMLPERISNELCSLKEGENRPSLAVRMVFDADGRKRSHSFHRVLFRSAAKLSYQQAQAAIDGRPDDKTGPILEHDPQAALGRLWRHGQGARQARPARPRPARAQDHPRRQRHGRRRPRARAARRPPAHRGDDDRGQCRGRRNAGEAPPGAALPRPRRAERRKAHRAARLPLLALAPCAAGRLACGPSISTASSPRPGRTGRSSRSPRSSSAPRRRPSMRPRTTAISASTSIATPTSPRPSAAMPT